MIKRIVLSLMIIISATQSYGFGEFFTAFSEAKSSVIEKFLERFLMKSLAEEKNEKYYENNFVEYNVEKLEQDYQEQWKNMYQAEWKAPNEKCRKNICFELFDTFPRLKDKNFVTVFDEREMLRKMYQLFVKELENKESKSSVEIRRILYSNIPDLTKMSKFLTQKDVQANSNLFQDWIMIRLLKDCKQWGYINDSEIHND